MASKRPLTSPEAPSSKRITRSTAAKLAADSEPGFPSSLRDFGYEFVDGVLTDIETNGKFEFEFRKGDKAYNQKRYEALGELITEHVYELLETECHLKKFTIPVDAKEGEPTGFVFGSEDLFECDKLLVLIHGAGVVRAGQWARRLIINDSLHSGTMIPYITRAQSLGYGILILNHNQNLVKYGELNNQRIRGSGNSLDHGVYVWQNIVEKCAATSVAIVAHSMGGLVTFNIAQNSASSFCERVKCVAFTDASVSTPYNTNTDFWKHMTKVSCNWMSSKQPIDTPLASYGNDGVRRVSAGTNVHEETSHRAIDSVFRFLEQGQKEKEIDVI